MKKFISVLLSAILLCGCLSAPVSAFGSYAQSARAAVLGDANGSGELDLPDAVAILRHLAHLSTGDFDESVADYDGNHKVDLSDAVAILRVLAKLDPPKQDLMDTVEVEQFCPASASDNRSGVTYPKAEHIKYYSEFTKCDRWANVMLPANYDPSKKYPVVYVLHGIFGDENTLTNEPAYKFKEITTNLAIDGLAKEMIIVFPNMYATGDPSLQPGFTNEQVLPYDNFIYDLTGSLMPYIEEHYPVLTGRENTAIAGFSMGGREALFIGLERPDLFAYCGAFAPAPGLTPMRDWAMEHKGQLSENELTFEGKEYSPKLLMICGGTNDHTVGDTYKKYDEIMTSNGVKHICYDVPGADHDANAVNSGFYNFVRYIF